MNVVALDVGHGQIDWTLRNDPRVVVIESFNARHLALRDLPGPVGVVVIDVSFISLTLIVPFGIRSLDARFGDKTAIRSYFPALEGPRVRGAFDANPIDRSSPSAARLLSSSKPRRMTSRAMVAPPTTWPLTSRTAEMVTDTSTRLPSLRLRTTSNGSTRRPASTCSTGSRSPTSALPRT